MNLETLKKRLPDYAKDIRLNLGAVPRTTGLSAQQLWGIVVATAHATRQPEIIAGLTNEARTHLSPEALEAARGAAAIMAMNNVYYRFLHLNEDPEYGKMPARLRMHIIGSPGVDRLDFELWCLAVSTINGCGNCIASHTHELVQRGGTRQLIQDAVRIASIIHATAAVLDGVDALQAVESQAA